MCWLIFSCLLCSEENLYFAHIITGRIIYVRAILSTLDWALQWNSPNKNAPSTMRTMRKFKSSCASAKYHQALCSPFIHSVVSNNSVRGQGRPWSDCPDAQVDLGLRCPDMPEDTLRRHVYAWRGPQSVKDIRRRVRILQTVLTNCLCSV